MADKGESRPRTGPSVMAVPDGDDRLRLVCPDCGYVEYRNPKVIVGAVCLWEDRFLMCRRAIHPRKGFWTVPAGYMEMDETTADGARREAMEEACAAVEIRGLIGIYEIPRISQIYVIHHARMTGPAFAAGPESAEVGLFAWDDIPWDEIAFSSVAWALRQFRAGALPTVEIDPHGL